jgi:hypothetical protein
MIFGFSSPARFPKMGRTGNFRPFKGGKHCAGDRFDPESARAKTKSGNFRRPRAAY